MVPFIKICGMTNAADALYACELGADAVGFIHYPKSPRHVSAEIAAEIAQQLPGHVLTFCVTVNSTMEEILAIEKLWQPDVWQLHGHEPVSFIQELAPRRCVKALGLPWTLDFDPADYPVDLFLLDKASPAYGGTGESFDWNLALELKKTLKRPIVLSGGLNPNNVVEAIQRVQPWGVDVCSGVESSPGKKNAQQLKEFINLCRNPSWFHKQIRQVILVFSEASMRPKRSCILCMN